MLTYTFVVPVYNTAQYLEECVQSILQQTYSSFKVLLIDDGSTDNSWDICKRLANSDNRIEIRHVNNGGPSKIRNIGIKECKTDYIWFVDSDDRLKSDDILSKINDKLTKHYSDILFFLSGKYNEDFTVCTNKQGPYQFEGNIEMSGEMLLTTLKTQENIMSVGTSPVNKVIKRELLQKNQSYFIESFRWGEEDEFLSKTIFYSSNFYFLNIEGYQVRIRLNSLSTATNQEILEKKILTNVELVDSCCHFFNKNSQTKELKTTMFTYYSYYYLFGLKKYFLLKDKAYRIKVKKFSLGHPFIFKAMRQSYSKNIRCLAMIYYLFGWSVMLKFVKWRYCKGEK